MKQDEEKVVKEATLERNGAASAHGGGFPSTISEALAHCERTSERCIRISAKVRAAKKLEEK